MIAYALKQVDRELSWRRLSERRGRTLEEQALDMSESAASPMQLQSDINNLADRLMLEQLREERAAL